MVLIRVSRYLLSQKIKALQYVCYSSSCHFENINIISNRPGHIIPPLKTYVGLNFVCTKKFHLTISRQEHVKKTDGKISVDSEGKSKKKEFKTYITLYNTDGKISVTTLEEAKKIADRRNLKVIKLLDFDSKSGRAVFKLVTEAQYLKDDSGWMDTKSQKGQLTKGEKVVSLSSRTSEHDVLTKVKLMKKWLEKRIEVRVVVTGDAAPRENIYKIIEKEIGSDGRILQKRVKGSDLRFQIVAPKQDKKKVNETEEKES